MDPRAHWEQVYASKAGEQFSWFQAVPATSLMLLNRIGLGPETCLIDVGGGDSRLVDALLDRGLTCLTVVDVSHRALERARLRLGSRHQSVTWIQADVTADWRVPVVDIWHDRAAFHFLTDARDRASYVARLHEAVKPGGHAVIATFAPEGPETCSGLPVRRYSPAALADEVGPAFTLVDAVGDPHQTPSGGIQVFSYVWFRRDEHVAP
jgi:trans-aconitate methyltransferase